MSNLKLVTITGASDDTDPKALHKLSQEFPFVEWAFLVSRTRTGLEPRYPSLKWLSDASSYEMNKAVHLCGKLARNALSKPDNACVFVDTIVDGATRIQLNVSDVLGRKEMTNVQEYILADWMQGRRNASPMQLIMQTRNFGDIENLFDGLGSELTLAVEPRFPLEKRYDYSQNMVFLHDASGGRGITGEFQAPPKNLDSRHFVGYAGGITPDNMTETLTKIEALKFPNPFWIDMESGVRTDDKLDLEKVRSVLAQAKDYIKRGPFTIE